MKDNSNTAITFTVEEIELLSNLLTEKIEARKNSVVPQKPWGKNQPTGSIVEGWGAPEPGEAYEWRKLANEAVRNLRTIDPDFTRLESLRSQINRRRIPPENVALTDPLNNNKISLIVQVLDQDRCYPEWLPDPTAKTGYKFGYRRIPFKGNPYIE